MAYAFEVAAVIPATPEEIFAAWMSSEEHSEMTGGAAEINPVVGGKFTAWDGYIWGTTLELESPRRIAQSWRTSQFADGEPDSKIEVILSPDSPGSTLLTIRHSEVPDDHRGYEDGGWLENYFEPMQEYFASR
jgi:uncharacterized protein YndB with AHSA1/START domain